MNKILLSIALIGCGTVHAAPCPTVLNGFPCARWTAPELMPNYQVVTPDKIKGHIVYYTRTIYGVTTRGQTAAVTDNSYFFQKAMKNAVYRFWVVTIYTDGTSSEPSNVEAAVRK